MTYYAKRSGVVLLLLALLAAALILVHNNYASILPRIVHLYGWALFLLMLVLSLYNARKKLPFLPIGTSEGWLQFHIYAGLFAVLIFAFHIRFRWPTGWFDSILFALYALVTFSEIAERGCEM